MTPYGAQFRLVARGVVDYLTGIDPSGAGLMGTLLTLIRRDTATHTSEGD
ncbi:MAG TPA: hypothetical protein VKH16_00480 [Gemmatimonadales bacterium]|nr:hypothetical protein [Gemmatimonadales bacterium]